MERAKRVDLLLYQSRMSIVRMALKSDICNNTMPMGVALL